MSDLSTPGPIILTAYERIAGDIHVAGFFARFTLRRRLYAAFREGHVAGDPRRAQREMGALLLDRDWRWPYFDRAVEEFRTLGVGPVAWQRDQIPTVAPWDDLPHRKRIGLLVLTLDHACYANRDRARHLEMVRDKSLPRGWKQYLEPEFKGCAIEKLLMERHGAGIESSDHRAALPPYFPGDALSLRTHIPHRRRR